MLDFSKSKYSSDLLINCVPTSAVRQSLPAAFQSLSGILLGMTVWHSDMTQFSRPSFLETDPNLLLTSRGEGALQVVSLLLRRHWKSGVVQRLPKQFLPCPRAGWAPKLKSHFHTVGAPVGRVRGFLGAERNSGAVARGWLWLWVPAFYFRPCKKRVFFSPTVAEKTLSETHRRKSGFLWWGVVFEVRRLPESCLKVWNGGNGPGRDGLLHGGQVSHDKCVMYQIQTAVLSDGVRDYTFSPFLFFHRVLQCLLDLRQVYHIQLQWCLFTALNTRQLL